MKYATTMIAALLFLVPAGVARAGESGCMICHSRKLMPERLFKPAVGFEKGVHAKAGLTCASCHGGDPNTTSWWFAHSSNFLGKPRPEDIVALCARCHDDAAKMKSLGAGSLPVGQGKAFARSVHGKVEEVTGYEKPTCISCHGVHGILKVTDPKSPVYPTNVPETCNRCHGNLDYMRAFTSARVRVDQFIAYKTSRHGKLLAKGDTKVAVCSSCHGSHDILSPSDPNSSVYATNVATTCGRCHSDPNHMKGYRIPAPGGGTRPLPTNQVALYDKSVHHYMLTKKGDLSAPTCNDCHGNHGATPPQVRTVANICSQCHSKPAGLFYKSEAGKEIKAAHYPGCATCHGYHDIMHPNDLLLEGVSKGRTHLGWVPGPKVRNAAKEMLAGIRDLDKAYKKATAMVDRAANYGMDVTRARLKLNNAHDRLVNARVSIHSYDAKKLDGILRGDKENPGGMVYTKEAEKLAAAAMVERRFRRQGLVVALVIILIVMTALVLKIRRVDAEHGPVDV